MPQQPNLAQLAGVQQVKIQQSIHRGPIPPPEVIEAYNRILPGAADRILAIAEREQAHFHQIELRGLRHYSFTVYLGQVSALVIGLPDYQ